MWMGFADQQANGAGPAPICTFAGSPSARFTTAAPGDYFDNGAIQHLSRVLLDLLQYFDMATPSPSPETMACSPNGCSTCSTHPTSAPVTPISTPTAAAPRSCPTKTAAQATRSRPPRGIGTNIDPATGKGEQRLGHLSALQRSSRAPDGTPVHIRMDGPGFHRMDVPDGSTQPNLQFTIFVPTADFFAAMRRNHASADLVNRYQVPGCRHPARWPTASAFNSGIGPERARHYPAMGSG
jgi:hypothetical protein